MSEISLTINGRDVRANVEPRTHLADFLRGDQSLTGTHIGCEHGVCGACTVLIDGAPARSCIVFAVACDGANVTTIEGLENDAVMTDLREAFSKNHALQCGYCTPGMLISARDIVTRLPDADERRVRLELSGNLCRCTGYVGIVAATQSVMQNHKERATPERRKTGPVGAHASKAPAAASPTLRRPIAARPSAAPVKASGLSAEQWAAVEADGVELVQSFQISHSRDEVWRFFDDLDQVARCMPGARLTKPPENGHAEGEVNVKLGPIVAAFAGIVDVERDENRFCGTVRATGSDAKSASSARALIAYNITALEQSDSRVNVSVKFLLTGALAQFSRSGLVKDVADNLTRIFARNLEARLSGAAIADEGNAPLDANALARAALWARIRAFFRKLFG
jgi:carbon-monoxide dehydrogenase small subunit